MRVAMVMMLHCNRGRVKSPLLWYQPWEGLQISGWSEQPKILIGRPFQPVCPLLPRHARNSCRHDTKLTQASYRMPASE